MRCYSGRERELTDRLGKADTKLERQDGGSHRGEETAFNSVLVSGRLYLRSSCFYLEFSAESDFASPSSLFGSI